MSEAFIEFYCDEDTFEKFRETPSFYNAKALYSLEAKEENGDNRFIISHILVCHSRKSAMDTIAGIRAWMRGKYGMNLGDPQRVLLTSKDGILAELRQCEFNPDDYFYDYFIKETPKSL